MTTAFESERLLLRQLTLDDAQDIYDHWAKDEECTRYLTWYPHESVEVTKVLLKNWVSMYGQAGVFRYGIERREDHELIGMIDVTGIHNGVPEIGYVSGKAYWGYGYMTEALHQFLLILKNAGYENAYIRALQENIGSCRVIEKNGFQYIGIETMNKGKREGHVLNCYTMEIKNLK